MIPQIKLKVGSPKFIAKKIYGLIKNVDLEDRNKFVFNMPLKLAKKVKNSKKFKDVNGLIKFVEEQTAKKLGEETRELQKKWDEKNEGFFLHLKKVLETNFSSEIFTGYVTNVMVGNYGENDDFIVRIDNNLNKSQFIIAEEVLHLVYWKIWKKVFDKGIEKPWKLWRENQQGLSVWKISETIPEYVFDIDNSREKSYPWLPEARKILDPLWKNRKSFEDFLIKAHKGLIDVDKNE